MARTKASVGAKVSSGKSSKARCSAAPPPTSSCSGSSNKSSHSTSGGSGGGNSVCAQPTPKWQRPITNFFISKDVSTDGDSDNGAGTSTTRPKKRNVIESDDEEVPRTTPHEEQNGERPKNSVLDESIELAPLTGEDSHKIEEYYQKNGETTQNGEHEESDSKNGENHESSEILPKITKGKGVGKKTNKENISVNVEIEKRKSVKRDLEDVEENNHENKKVKVN